MLEALRVARRLHFRIVVEIAVDVALPAPRSPVRIDPPRVDGLAPGYPCAYSRSPSCERRRRVTADIELLVAVEADVEQLGGDVLGVRPFARGIGDDKRDSLLAQHRDEGGFDKVRNSDF